MKRLYLGNNHHVKLESLTDDRGTFVEGAQVSMTLYESDKQTEVQGALWPILFEGEGKGNYRGRLPATLEIVPGEMYYLKIRAQMSETVFEGWFGLLGVERLLTE